MVGWHHWLNRHEFEQTQGDGEGQGSLACCSPWSNWTTKYWYKPSHLHSYYFQMTCRIPPHILFTPFLTVMTFWPPSFDKVPIRSGLEEHRHLKWYEDNTWESFVYITVSLKSSYTFTSKQPQQDFPDGPAVRNLAVQGTQVQSLVREDATLPLQGAWVWSPVGELRSHMLCRVAKKG